MTRLEKHSFFFIFDFKSIVHDVLSKCFQDYDLQFLWFRLSMALFELNPSAIFPSVACCIFKLVFLHPFYLLEVNYLWDYVFTTARIITRTYWHLSPQHGTPSGCGGGKGLRIWRAAPSILNKQWRTADKEWCSSMAVGRGVNNSPP